MKNLSYFVVLGLLMSCSIYPKKPTVNQWREVASSKYLNDESMSIINLNKIKILNSDGENTFPYVVTSAPKISAKIKAALLAESGDDQILSKIFSIQKGESSFKNIYAFTTKRIDSATSTTYRVNIVFENKSGSMTLIDYDIKDASNKELKTVNGPTDQLEKLRIVAEVFFFPI